MAVVMLLKNKRFSQKASLRRKEVRKRAWARSALKLAKVTTDSVRVLGLFLPALYAATSAPARKGRGHKRDPRQGAPPRRARSNARAFDRCGP